MACRPTFMAVSHVALLVAVATVATSRASAQQPSRMNDAPLGRYQVGFRSLVQYDYARTYHGDYDANGDTVTGERARPIQTSIWYPANPRPGATPMPYSEYVVLSALEEGPVVLDAARRRRTVERYAKEFEVDPGDFTRVISHATHAYPDARPLPGRFPLIVYGPSFSAPSWENAELCELLASHGYVVVASPALGVSARGQSSTLESVEAEARDMEFLIGYSHTLPDANVGRLAVMGFSWGGLADMIVALRNPGVDAVVALDGSIRYWDHLIQHQPYGDPSRLTAPFLFLAQATIPADTAAKYGLRVSGRSFPFYDSVHYADSYYLTLEKMHHQNFGAWFNLLTGPAERSTWSDSAAVRRSYQLTESYVLNFLDAYLKGDQAARGFLQRTPEANGAPEGWVVASAKTRRPLHPDVNTFAHYLRTHGGWPAASEAVEALRQTDPEFTLPESELITLGDADLDDHHFAEAHAVFTVNVLLHPKSPDAYGALGHAYVATHDTALALANYRQSLTLDSTQTATKAAIDQLSHR